MKLPSDIKTHLQNLPVFSAVLWKTNKYEQPIFVVKVPPATNFASYAIGFSSITNQSLDKSHTFICLVLTLQNTNVGKNTKLIQTTCLINPFSKQDQEVGDLLTKTNTIIVAAVDAGTFTFLGAKRRSWPRKKSQQFSRLLYKNYKKRTSQAVTPFTSISNEPEPINKKIEVPTKVKEKSSLSHETRSALPKSVITTPPRTQTSSLSQNVHYPILEKAEYLRQPEHDTTDVYVLTATMLETIAAILEKPSLPPVSLPDISLRIKIELPIRGYAHEAHELLIISPKHNSLASFPKGKKDVKDVTSQQESWQLHVVDKHGLSFLQLLYHPNLEKWDFASTHKCPINRCVDITSLIQAHALDKPSPLLPCQSCQEEAIFWQKALPAILATVYRYQHIKTPSPSIDTPIAKDITASPTSTFKDRKEIFSLPLKAHQVLAPLPSLTGILFSTKELQYTRPPFDTRPSFGNLPLLLIKLPETYPFEECNITFQEMQRYKVSPRGLVACLNMALHHPTQANLTIQCLFILSAEDDYNILSRIALQQISKVDVVAVSDNQLLTTFGIQQLTCSTYLAEQAKKMIKRPIIDKYREKGATRTLWIQDYFTLKSTHIYQHAQPITSLPPLQVPAHVPVQLSSSTPSFASRPKTLLEAYLNHLTMEQQQLSNAKHLSAIIKERKNYIIKKQREAIAQAYICEVKNSALQMLLDLLSQQKQLLLKNMPQLPSSSNHLWLEFEKPVSSSYGTTTIDVWVVWIRKCSPEEVAKSGQTIINGPQWICTLLGDHAEDLGCSYLYTPYETNVWQVSKEYRCPDQRCKPTIMQLCSRCREGLEFWATTLNLLLKMHRGDYAVRENIQRNVSTAKLIVEPLYSKGPLRNTFVMKHIDTSLHQVHSRLSAPVPRGSWLKALQATHPELIETAQVHTKEHWRYIKSLGRYTHVSAHYKTIHRRKDKVRRNILKAEYYYKKMKKI